MIPYGRQNIIEEDINSVVNVMKSDFLTQGPITPKFEDELKTYCKANFAVAVVNATSALHISCLALGVKKGDFVWTSPISFVASANAALYCGAEVDFVDSDLDSYNMCVNSLEEKLINAKKKGKLPKVVMPVHLAGQSCEMKKIYELSQKYNFRIIEDASHSIGAEYLNEKVGNCKYSDITVFSFHPVKIITTCEGGACMTNDKDLYEKLYRLRSHGIVRNQEDMENISHGSWYYEQIDLGFNYRLNDLQAALGISQLQRIDNFVKLRHEVSEFYYKNLNGIENIILPKQSKNTYSSFHLFVIRVLASSKDAYSRKNLFDKLRNNGIFVNIHYIPIYKQPFYKKLGYKNLENTETYYKQAISIPIYPYLKKRELNKILSVIKSDQNFQTLF